MGRPAVHAVVDAVRGFLNLVVLDIQLVRACAPLGSNRPEDNSGTILDTRDGRIITISFAISIIPIPG